jgi:hypothetical protein
MSSISELNLDIPKTWLNPRINSLTVDSSLNFGKESQNLNFDCQVAPTALNFTTPAFEIDITLITNNFPAGATSAKIRINNPSILSNSNILCKLHNYSAVAIGYSVVAIGYAETILLHTSDGYFDLQLLSNGYADMLIGQTFHIDFLIF